MRVGWHVIAFFLAEAAVLVLDVLFGKDVALTGLYSLPVLALALRSGTVTVVGAAALAFVLGLVSGQLNDIFLQTRHLVRLLIVATGAGASIAFTVVRSRLRDELATQRLLAAENDRLLADLHATEREIAAVVAAIADGVLVHDATGRTVYANQAAADILGLPDAAAIVGSTPGDIPGRFTFVGEDGGPLDADVLPGRRIFAGDPNPEAVLLRSIDRETGREMWTLTKATAILGPDGQPALAVNVIEDVTAARRRSAGTALLAEAGEVLGSSLDLQGTLERIVQLVVPALADWCSVDFPAGVFVVPAAMAHADPDTAPLAEAMMRRFPARTDEEFGVAAVLRGEPTFVRANLTPERLAVYARDEEHQAALTRAGVRHVMFVGMRAGEETIGALSFVRGASRPEFSPDEIRLAEELGRRAGTAVLNARLYEARTEVATILQRSLLPPELPQPEGLTMAAHYRATGLAQAGGDFYDAFPVPDGWLVAIGDVTGKGPAAAALTGLARAGLEAVATLTGRPALALAHLNGLLARRGDMALASVAALHFHAGREPLRVSVFCAGHPAPLLLRRGAVIPVAASGPLLGAFGGERWDPAEIELEPGDVIVLRTDGVTDAVGSSGRLGEERLRAALVWSPAGDAQAAVDLVRRLVEDHEAGEPRDDVAILAVAVTGPALQVPVAEVVTALPSLAVAVTLDGVPASVARARALVDEHLAAILPARRLDDVRLLISELASNAVKHAGGSFGLALDLDARRLRVELSDDGPGPVAGAAATPARGSLPEGGYGLGIVDQLASRWGVVRGDGHPGTRVWFEVPRD